VAAQFHPAWPLVATGGGHRDLLRPTDTASPDDDDEDEDGGDDDDGPTARASAPSTPVDCSLRVWRLGSAWSTAQST
jgi:hypothetical protein